MIIPHPFHETALVTYPGLLITLLFLSIACYALLLTLNNRTRFFREASKTVDGGLALALGIVLIYLFPIIEWAETTSLLWQILTPTIIVVLSSLIVWWNMHREDTLWLRDEQYVEKIMESLEKEEEHFVKELTIAPNQIHAIELHKILPRKVKKIIDKRRERVQKYSLVGKMDLPHMLKALQHLIALVPHEKTLLLTHEGKMLVGEIANQLKNIEVKFKESKLVEEQHLDMLLASIKREDHGLSEAEHENVKFVLTGAIENAKNVRSEFLTLLKDAQETTYNISKGVEGEVHRLKPDFLNLQQGILETMEAVKNAEKELTHLRSPLRKETWKTLYNRLREITA